jgi:ribonuclease T2
VILLWHCARCAPGIVKNAGSIFVQGIEGEGMLKGAMAGILLRGLIAISLAGAMSNLASAQGRRDGEPGQFDFYVLSLSWSPSFCAAAAERGRGRPPTLQCAARPFSFVVHGLWPQYDRGFPENCQVPAPRLDHRIVDAMLDLMPAPRLVYNEWDKHGTCSGLSARDYFATIRKARSAVTIPADYVGLQKPLSVSPDAVEDAFIKANPGLAKGDVAVSCDRRRLTEIRVCLTKDLKFRACPQVVKRSCRNDNIVMPPVRGGPG